VGRPNARITIEKRVRGGGKINKKKRMLHNGLKTERKGKTGKNSSQRLGKRSRRFYLNTRSATVIGDKGKGIYKKGKGKAVVGMD